MCDDCLMTKTECACRCRDLYFSWRLEKSTDHRSYRNAELECAGCCHRLAVADNIRQLMYRAWYGPSGYQYYVENGLMGIGKEKRVKE